MKNHKLAMIKIAKNSKYNSDCIKIKEKEKYDYI